MSALASMGYAALVALWAFASVTLACCSLSEFLKGDKAEGAVNAVVAALMSVTAFALYRGWVAAGLLDALLRGAGK